MTYVADAGPLGPLGSPRPEPALAGPGQPYPGGYPAARYESDPFTRFVLRAWSRAPRVTAPLLALVCFAGGVGYTLAVRPADSDAAASPTCLVKMTTGFDCPGCGGTRAFWFLLHGDLPAAARSHLLAVFAVPFVVYLYLAWAANLVFRRQLPALRVTPRTVSVFLAAWAVFAVLRNLPWAPFSWFYV